MNTDKENKTNPYQIVENTKTETYKECRDAHSRWFGT